MKAFNDIDNFNFRIVDKDEIAYVYPSDKEHTIYLGNDFWDCTNDINKPDSKPGILIHEISHFKDTLATDDLIYGNEGENSSDMILDKKFLNIKPYVGRVYDEYQGGNLLFDNADNLEY